MSRIGTREIYFIKAMQPHQVDYLIDQVKASVKEMTLPSDYDVRVYKNVLSCCGIGGLSLIIEVAGPEEEKIRSVDLRAVSRILEFCEKEGYDIGYHSFGQFETV